MKRGQVMELEMHEAIVSKMEELGWQAPVLDEDAVVASDLLPGLTWQEHEPLERRLGNLHGMVEHLRSRPMPDSKAGARRELSLLEAIQKLVLWAEALEAREPDGFSEELAFDEERAHFEDAMFVVTEDFFEWLDSLDEPFPV